MAATPDKMAARRRLNRRILIGFGVAVALLVIVVMIGSLSAEDRPAPSAGTSPATTAPVALPTMAAPPSTCSDAPTAIVDIINASFTDGQHLEHAQAVTGPNSTTYVGGNIFDAAGVKESSQDTWVLSDGVVYAITSDARQRTTLPDGRDVEGIALEWPGYNDAVGACVGQLERAENQGG